MVVAKDPSGQLDEKYIYHEVIENPADLASADAFDPDRRWGESKGLLLPLRPGRRRREQPERPSVHDAITVRMAVEAEDVAGNQRPTTLFSRILN